MADNIEVAILRVLAGVIGCFLIAAMFGSVMIGLVAFLVIVMVVMYKHEQKTKGKRKV